MKSKCGRRDIFKFKGSSLHYANQQKFNVETLKTQVLYEGFSEDLDRTEFEESMIHQNKRPQVGKLVLHTNKTIMRRNKFQIMVEENAGKASM